MAVKENFQILENVVKVSFEKVYLAVRHAEVEYHQRQASNIELSAAADITDSAWVPTLSAAVRQLAPLPDGGFMSLQNLLLTMCIPATVGRSSRMLELIRCKNIDWKTAFASTSEDKQANSGEGKRTRAYERVKKARQRLVNERYMPVDVPTVATISWIMESQSPRFIADCAKSSLDWRDSGKAPGPLLRSLAHRLVAEGCIADEQALSLAAKLTLREAAMRFISLQCEDSPTSG